MNFFTELKHESISRPLTANKLITWYANGNSHDVKDIPMSEEKKPEWILIKDAAEMMNLHIESVRRLCRNETIKCRQLYKNAPWEVWREDAENYERNYGGRPRDMQNDD